MLEGDTFLYIIIIIIIELSFILIGLNWSPIMAAEPPQLYIIVLYTVFIDVSIDVSVF